MYANSFSCGSGQSIPRAFVHPIRSCGAPLACGRSDTTGCIIPSVCRRPFVRALPVPRRSVCLSRRVLRSCGSFEEERNPSTYRLYMRVKNPMRRRCLPQDRAEVESVFRPLGRIVHWSDLLLRNLQSLGNELKHAAPPVLEFFGDVTPWFAWSRTFPSALVRLLPYALTCASELPTFL